MRLFVKKTDTVSVEVFAYEEDGKVEAVLDEKEVPKTASETSKLLFTFRRPGYKDSRLIASAAKVRGSTDENAGLQVDITSFYEKILKTLLVSWDLKDGEDEIEVKTSSIDGLQPEIARAAVAALLLRVNL